MADKRTRVTNPEAAAAELAEHYARILGQQADRRVSAVIRTCLSRIPSRLPIQGEDLHAVEELVGRVLRLGEVGARDPVGSPRQIDDYIAGRLGEPASELLDPSSKVHRALLAETPALYSLPASDTDTAVGASALRGEAGEADDLRTPPQLVEPLTADSSPQLRLEVARLQEELAAERLARAEVDRRLVAAEAALEAEHRARGEADQQVQVAAARLTTLEQELRRLRGAIDDYAMRVTRKAGVVRPAQYSSPRSSMNSGPAEVASRCSPTHSRTPSESSARCIASSNRNAGRVRRPTYWSRPPQRTVPRSSRILSYCATHSTRNAWRVPRPTNAARL